jgi:hypothetical protein
MNKLSIGIVLAISLFSNTVLANSNAKWTKVKTYKFNFSEPFSVSYADYPAGEERFFELYFTPRSALPSEIVSSQRCLKISGNNHSDDLFMYAYKKLDNLKPNTRYQVSFSLEFASNATKDCIGTGGSPGASVYMKIGVVSKKPTRSLDSGNYYRIDLDKGNQAQDGKDMILIGDISVDNQDALYRLKTLPYEPNQEMAEKINNYHFTSTKRGEGWVIFGSDSGYESTSTLFYTNLVVTFKEID